MLIGMLAFISVNASYVLERSLYPGMLFLLFIASLGVPIPEDIPLLLGGAFTRLGYGELPYTILIGMIGVLSGDIILYFAGRKFGLGVLRFKPFRSIATNERIAHMKIQFRKRGNWIIFFGRFFAGIRSVMCVTAGICRVPAWKFILIDFTGALCSVPLLILVGWFFSHNIKKVAADIQALEKILGITAAILVVAWFVYLHLSKRSKLTKIEKSTRAELMSDEPVTNQELADNKEFNND
jgi:membrane protein DedA with SNARE-associated domain